MKSRSMKLREVHKNSTTGSCGEAVCSVVWAPDGGHITTASSADSEVLIHSTNQQPPRQPKILKHHREGVTALALSPAASATLSLASGSLDHSVKLYSFPEGEFQTNITRFTLPIRSLAFNKSGSLLAAAGDDDGIKLVATIDNSISRVLKGHSGPVTALSFDPLNEFLASVDSFGTVIYWELSSGKSVHTLRSVSPNCGSETSLLNVVAWSPDGEILAVPGLRNDVVMYDRDTAEKLFTLRGDHEREICYLAWSPNGKYVATSGLDNQVLIWDVDKREDIERQKFDDRISCLAWRPNGNALAVIDVVGMFGVWESPVPSIMKSPTEGALMQQERKMDGFLFFDDDEEKPPTSGSLEDLGEESLSETAPVSRKRLRKHSTYESSDEDIDDREGLLREIESSKRHSVRLEKHATAKEDSVTSRKSARAKLQEAFQPCSTPVHDGKRRFLSYNLLGSITSFQNDGYCHIEVDFHDTGRGPRVPSMTDYFGFTMAALNENGSIFACPCKDEKQTSTLMYRPFSSWASNSEWSMRFEAEEVKAVALGDGWAAAISNLNYLRIFTDGGLQKHILCLNGPVVTAAGFKEKLAIVFHASDCLSSGDQMLEVRVFDIIDGTQTIACRLPLTPSSTLAWFGFSEEGHLSAYDSKGVLRVLSNQFGGSWLPLFSASKSRKSEDENYWVVGLNTNHLFCIVCKEPESYPSVSPKPVLTLLSLSFPLACSDLGAADLENEFMMCNLYLSQTQRKIEEMAAAGLDTTSLDDDIFNMEATLDRCILRLIASCCNGDKLVRATELANLLSLEKSVKGAIKLATALKHPNLAERFNGILEERLFDSKGTVAVPAITSNLSTRKAPTNYIVKSSEPVMTSLSHSKKEMNDLKNMQPDNSMLKARPAKAIINQEKTEDKAKAKVAEPCQILKKVDLKEVDNPMPCRNPNKESSSKGNQKTKSEGKTHSPDNPFAKVTDGNSHQPQNPFAKATLNNHNKSSLLDSLKKMKADSTTKAEGSKKQ